MASRIILKNKSRLDSLIFERDFKKAFLFKKAKMFYLKKAIIFDLDGTITKSKVRIDKEMSSLFCEILKHKKVLVIGGGNLSQFKSQFLNYLLCPRENLKNLFIAPTSGASMYKNKNGKWQKIYHYNLTKTEKKKIISFFEKILLDIKYPKPKKTYGKLIEDRGAQITFSALGQKAPLLAKEKWHKTSDMRRKLKKILEKYLPEFEVRLGGLTSIDITKKGINKSYGVRQFARIIRMPIKSMLYVGDALYEGGNDSVIRNIEIDTFQVNGPKDTKFFIKSLILFLNSKIND